MPDAQPEQMEQRMVTDAMIEAGENALCTDRRCECVPERIYAAMQAARPTPDLGDDGELVERLRGYDPDPGKTAWQAADRLILYREARDVLTELVDMIEQAFPALAHQPLMVRARAVLSRSRG